MRLLHLRRSLLAGGSALAAAAALALGSAGAASAGAHPSAASQAAAARAALRGLSVPGAQHRLAGGPQGVRGLTKVSSDNWSGYADTGSGYSKVSSTWTQPAVTCNSSATQLAAFWVGIDGFSSKTVEQDGTLAECFDGTAFYYTWWEMYPSNDIQTVGSTVKPGDKIAASVVRTGTSYALKITDSTTSGNSFSKKETCSAATCVDSSAEWIAEAPTGSAGIYPLPDFAKWTAASDAVSTTSKSGTIKTFADDEITMKGASDDTLAAPGALNSAGNSFSVTWKHST
jgi:hypothetical protein